MNTESTLTRDVTERLQADIEQGTYAEMSRLPSERELAEVLGVSRVTVRRALKELELARFIQRHGTLGTFVSPRSEWQPVRSAPISHLEMFPHLATEFQTIAYNRAMPTSGLVSEVTGPPYMVELQAPERVVPNSYIGDRLNLIAYEEFPVIRRLRVVTAQGMLLELWDTYYPPSIFLPRMPDIFDSHAALDRHSLDQWLRELYGAERLRVTMDGHVRFPTAYEAHWLRISRQTPVVDLERIVRQPVAHLPGGTKYNMPVELSRIVAPTSSYSFGREYEQDGVEPASWRDRPSS